MKNSPPLSKKLTWKQIVPFGESLLNQPTIDTQRDLIISTFKNWFMCNVELWFIENPAHGDLPINWRELGSIPDEKVSLLQESYNCRKAVYIPTKNSILRVIAPLSINNTIYGFIELDRSTGPEFSKKEIELLDGLLMQSALAIQAMDKIHVNCRKLELLSLERNISSQIMNTLDLDELLAVVVDQIHKNLNYPCVFIYTVHPGRKKIFYHSGAGLNIPSIKREGISFDLDDAAEQIPMVARTGQPVLYSIESGASAHHPIQEISPILRSELILPVRWGSETLGILDIVSGESNAFTDDVKQILEALASNIGTAMRNATLYRSEQWRRKVTESVREVAGLLTADTELEQVLDRILTELEHTLPCDFAVIWLLEENANRSSEASEKSLSPAAVHISWQPENFGGEKGAFTPEDVIQICKETDLSSTWLQEALDSDFPLIRKSDSPYEPLGSVLDFPDNYSSIAAPLYIADHPLGILSLGHHTSDRYGHESQTMTATFASYAAVAIENTRLYEAAHDQAWISTVLLQVAEATQTLSSLDELLDTMARITPTLIGVNACVIFLWENAMGAFLPVASYGLEVPFEDKKNLAILKDNSPSFNQLLLTKAPVWLGQNEIDESGEMQLFTNFLLDKNTAALIPMIVHGDVQGAFLVDFSTTDQFDEEKERTYQLDEKFSIIQGIAHQTALSVENLQLQKSQQEEVYVSIALLQVAQAVVSLSDLDEALETIVRIAPILIGVKRAVIYLWDNEQSLFHISQSYGISRTDLLALQGYFSPDEHPLLHAVYRSNSVVYHDYTDETESPIAWNQITSNRISEAQLNLFPQDTSGESSESSPDANRDSYLKIQSSLLFAYPLSAKGEFLGVMITQEIETSGELISAQSRSRRQEITIGITQQAALAIQNARLQSEVVERGRMERELQLAREIQQTFLPDHLPVHSGWDLDVLWKPAREVGGDFYDVFDLPGNRLGLVIADVADKGMPAALFMTLVRTLIRATAREELSPSVVLEIVNDLLVKDTKHGLFITVAYAVISLETGQIIFANAGHNLPLLLRHQPRELEILETTGMALGVLEGIHIADMNTRLNRDDCLIFYTDGVTEAFSPEGEMFGETRLRNFILSGKCETAQQQLQAIDQAVQDFIGDLPYSDDITILTVRRSAS